jgi:hypothetical protein
MARIRPAGRRGSDFIIEYSSLFSRLGEGCAETQRIRQGLDEHPIAFLSRAAIPQ